MSYRTVNIPEDLAKRIDQELEKRPGKFASKVIYLVLKGIGDDVE